MQTVNPDRAWAASMEQDEFEVAYQRKYGAVDTIPYVKEWVYKENSKYRGIDPVKPADLLVDDHMESLKQERKERVGETKRIEEAGECVCSGCGKVAKSMFGLKAHQRHCKTFKENLNG